MLKYEVGDYINSGGTSLKGYLIVPKHILVRLLGEPTYNGYEPGDKVINEWVIEITDEEDERVVVTIYDWKTGAGGDLNDNFSDWHVGAHNAMDVELLRQLLVQLGTAKLEAPIDLNLL